MSIQELFYEIVSGRKTGAAAALLRFFLRCGEIPYGSAVLIRNFLYDKHFSASRQFPICVVSVGNLTLGGTGKSPMTAWLCRFFQENNLRPGIVSRGYKSKSSTCGTEKGNDEFKELTFRFPGIPHIQHRKRAVSVQTLLQTEPADCIILDDAFQHRQVARNVDIVLLDATSPFGFGHLFPRGTLREPMNGLRRADIVLLTRSDLISESERQNIRRQVLLINQKAVWGETIHVPASVLPSDTMRAASLASLEGQSALAFCGIGNPAAFRKTLEQCGVNVQRLIPFPDHYQYIRRDAERICQSALDLETDLILCTVKDLVKLRGREFADFFFQAVSIEIQFTHGESAVRERLLSETKK